MPPVRGLRGLRSRGHAVHSRPMDDHAPDLSEGTSRVVRLRWMPAAVFFLIGMVLAAAAVWLAAGGHRFAAGQVGLATLVPIIGVVVFSRMALRMGQIDRRSAAGECLDCGHDIGGCYDRPCPLCGSGSEPSPLSLPPIMQPWAAGAGLRRRELTLQPTERCPLVRLSVEPGRDGTLVVTDDPRLPRRAHVQRIAVLLGGALVVFAVLAIAAVLPAQSMVANLPAFLVVLFAVSAAPFVLVIALSYAFRNVRGRHRRTIIVDPRAGTITDERVRGGAREQRRGALADARLSRPRLHGWRPQALWRRQWPIGVVLWGPGGPILLASDYSASAIEEYVVGLPRCMRALEHPGPAKVYVWR